ncbi:TRAP transporter substrate-binding protein DctP [Clostridiaceae bacterium 35-E11]
MRKICVWLLCIVLAMGSFTACSSQPSTEQSGEEEKAEAKVFKIGHIRPADAVADVDVKAFAKDLEERSNSSLKLEIYPASQLGDYTVVQERVSIGDIEMQLAPLGTNLDKRFGISNAPYLVENWEQAKRLYSSEGKLVQAMGELLDKNDIKLLATYPLYFGGICLVKEPVDPGNPDVAEDIKIRVPPMKSFEKTAEALGFIATPLPWADTFTSMQTGIVEGAIGGGAEAYYSSMRDLIKYYLPVNDHFEMWYLYINKGVWEKLTPEEQNALQEAAKFMEEKRFEKAEAMEKEYENKLKELGIEVLEFSDEELSQFAKKARETVWPVIKSDFGEELFDSITSEIK